MKRSLPLLALALAFVLHLPAQATVHKNTFSCTASPDANATSSTSLYKAAGSCPTTVVLSAFKLLTPGLPNTCTSTDTAVVAGQTNSYVFTAVTGAGESGPSACLTLTTPTFPPQGPQGTAQ